MFLKCAEGPGGLFGEGGAVDVIVGLRAFDVEIRAPVIALGVLVPDVSIPAGDEGEDFAAGLGFALFFGDPLVAAVGGLAMLVPGAVALARLRRRRG